MCTAVGTVGVDNSRLLVADLSGGTWTTSTVARPPQAIPGTVSFSDVSCSAPRVCTAILCLPQPGTRNWPGGPRPAAPPAVSASRSRSGTWSVDIPFGLNCHGSGCTLVGAKDATDGQGDDLGAGTAFALRNQNGGIFTAQPVPEPPGTAGGELNHVSCAGAGFCAATTSGAGSFFDVPDNDPSVAVRPSPHGAWRYPANASHGFLGRPVLPVGDLLPGPRLRRRGRAVGRPALGPGAFPRPPQPGRERHAGAVLHLAVVLPGGRAHRREPEQAHVLGLERQQVEPDRPRRGAGLQLPQLADGGVLPVAHVLRGRRVVSSR